MAVIRTTPRPIEEDWRGSTFIKGLPLGSKVGDPVTVDGVDLGVIAATEYEHAKRLHVAALVPSILYWHLKLQFEVGLEGWDKLPAPLTLLSLPCHDPALVSGVSILQQLWP